MRIDCPEALGQAQTGLKGIMALPAKMKDGYTPLNAAIDNGLGETADLLKRKHGGKTGAELKVEGAK